LLAVVVFVGLGFWYMSYVESVTYLQTDNAKVTAKFYTVNPTVGGKLVRLNMAEGGYVTKDEVIARVENGPYIRSPIDGQVIKCDAVLDQTVSPQTQIAVIADVSKIYVGANIEETQIAKIKEGQDVTVNLDTYPGKKFKGHVEEIDQVTQTALSGNQTSFTTSGTYTKVTQLIPVKIYLDEDLNLENMIGTNGAVKIKIK
jgi:multidrug resistance efflux pump